MLLLKLIALFFLWGYSNHDRPTDNHVRRFLQRHEIPYHYLPTTSGNKREQEILELIEGTDFAVLARYMQVSVLSLKNNYVGNNPSSCHLYGGI
jgi:formyltetrahydrofolate hydrolase